MFPLTYPFLIQCLSSVGISALASILSVLFDTSYLDDTLKFPVEVVSLDTGLLVELNGGQVGDPVTNPCNQIIICFPCSWSEDSPVYTLVMSWVFGALCGHFLLIIEDDFTVLEHVDDSTGDSVPVEIYCQ